MIEPDLFQNLAAAKIRVLRREIRRARELSTGIVGVNIMVALTNFGELVKTASEEPDWRSSERGRPHASGTPRWRPAWTLNT
jgi:hypothetical protein